MSIDGKIFPDAACAYGFLQNYERAAFEAGGGDYTLPAQSAAILSYLDPAVALLLSALVLGEKLGLHGWIGAVLILGGALVSELNGNE